MKVSEKGGAPVYGLERFPVTLYKRAFVKKAAAMANVDLGMLPKDIGSAIVKACDEILEEIEGPPGLSTVDGFLQPTSVLRASTTGEVKRATRTV